MEAMLSNDPITPDIIAERAKAIRDGWSDAERALRARGFGCGRLRFRAQHVRDRAEEAIELTLAQRRSAMAG